ncbi:hypothetical protein BDV93DRAFT_529641 [Ceratobasidium sp. AG-I]|nr:hypothetical protein BDV93DRAFT_529641 [Ceratobasidium sp. AG-I]
MASNPPDDTTTIPSLGGNNQSHPPNVAGRYPSTFKDFDDIDKGNLLFDNAYLFGIHVDGNDGPRRSTRQIAKHKHSSLYPLITYQEKNSILTEMISTENDRSTRFVHQGWSKFAISTVTPWILSRITNNNHLAPIKDESHVTKRVIHQRLSVHVTMDALSPVPEFHASIGDALSKPTKFAKFEAIQECFAFWGDVLALEFDLGTSVSITDLQENFHGVRIIVTNLSNTH